MADNSLPTTPERDLNLVTYEQVKEIRVVDTSDNSKTLAIDNLTIAGTKVTVAVDGLSGTVDGAFGDVLMAIAEKADTTQVEALDEEKVDKTQSVIAGAGMTGGGALAGDVTLNVVTADDSLVVAADNIKVNTVDALTSDSATRPLSAKQGKALDAAKVNKTGNETIAGVKTFSSSPIVPDATTIHQAASLGQVSDLINGEEWYGVEWDTTISPSAITRIGKATLHASLPIQSGMRRCLLSDAGVVNYYLNPANSTLLDNGAPADLTGASGQVMVEIPSHYEKFETEGNKRRCKMSLYALPGYTYFPTMYISAYEATVDRTVTLTPKLCSVVNTAAEFRGGDNTSAWDGTYRTLLGRPATSLNLTQFRTYARNRGSVNWNCNAYLVQRILYWLIAVEYGNFNNQLAYNAALTAEGYRQGGLGNGVTDIDSTKWSNFNGYNPFVPCGHTNLLGNATGVVAYAMPSEYDATIKTTYVPTYRGVENPFGHVWKCADGCKCNIQSDASGALSEFYVCTNPANYQDTDYTNYVLRGVLPRSEGYIKSLIVGEFGEMMPLTVGGSETKYMCDFFYTSIPASGVSQRGVWFGGAASNGANAGVGCSLTNATATSAYAYLGSRLCYLPL